MVATSSLMHVPFAYPSRAISPPKVPVSGSSGDPPCVVDGLASRGGVPDTCREEKVTVSSLVSCRPQSVQQLELMVRMYPPSSTAAFADSKKNSKSLLRVSNPLPPLLSPRAWPPRASSASASRTTEPFLELQTSVGEGSEEPSC